MCKCKHLPHLCMPPCHMVNDVLRNPWAYTNGYSNRICPLCVLENGGIWECYTGSLSVENTLNPWWYTKSVVDRNQITIISMTLFTLKNRNHNALAVVWCERPLLTSRPSIHHLTSARGQSPRFGTKTKRTHLRVTSNNRNVIDCIEFYCQYWPYSFQSTGKISRHEILFASGYFLPRLPWRGRKDMNRVALKLA